MPSVLVPFRYVCGDAVDSDDADADADDDNDGDGGADADEVGQRPQSTSYDSCRVKYRSLVWGVDRYIQ